MVRQRASKEAVLRLAAEEGFEVVFHFNWVHLTKDGVERKYNGFHRACVFLHNVRKIRRNRLKKSES